MTKPLQSIRGACAVLIRYLLADLSRASLAPGGGLRSEGESTLYWNIAKMAVRRPRLIPYLLGAAWAFRARDWYRRPPFLPLPPRSYLAWRLDTAYGDPDATPPIDEFERYLVWSAGMRAQMRRDRG